jgi:hypothetical protein
MSKPKLRPDTGLAAMVAGAAEDDSGHLILADWIEENLQIDDLAAILRTNGGEPRPGKEARNTGWHDFRWRQIDDWVMMYMAHFRLYQPYTRGKKPPPPIEGRLLGFLVNADGRSSALRWVRWLAGAKQTESCDCLWDDLGVAVPIRPRD